jgi:hypothetical protein
VSYDRDWCLAAALREMGAECTVIPPGEAICYSCRGTGQVGIPGAACMWCRGSGKVPAPLHAAGSNETTKCDAQHGEDS